MSVILILNLFILPERYRFNPEGGYFQKVKASACYSVEVTSCYFFLLVIKNKYSIDFQNFFCAVFVCFFAVWMSIYFFQTVLKFVLLRTNWYKTYILLVVDSFSDKDFDYEPDVGYEIQAYIHLNSSLSQFGGKPILRNLVELEEFISENNVEEVYISSWSDRDRFLPVLELLKILEIPVNLDLKAYSFLRAFLHDWKMKLVGDRVFLISSLNHISNRMIFFKRTMDIFGSIIGIVLMLIVGTIIYPIVQKESKGPLLFKQKRVGKNGKAFEMYKFRSMYLDAEEKKKDLLHQNMLNSHLMFKIKDDPRIFPFGKVLRESSLDELPQFINVLKGEMSLVGTRPPTLEEYKKYELHHFKRLLIKPGITGLWQVSGRNDIKDFDQVVALDLKYIKNMSVMMDIKIIFKTIQVVWKKSGSM